MSTNLTVSAISRRSPDMSAAEFDRFVEDIRTNGQLVPIWVRGDEVIDGRKRLAACERLGIEPRTVNVDPSQDAERISTALNVLRTHYTPSQRAMFAAERVTASKADGARIRYGSIIPKNRDDRPLVSERMAATEAGVDKSAISVAKRLTRTAAPEVVNKVKEGKLTLHAASQIAQLPKPDQPAAVEKVIAASKGKARHTPTATVLNNGQDVRKDRSNPRAPVEQFMRALDGMETYTDIISQTADAARADVRAVAFIDRLRTLRTELSRAISRLETK